MFTKVTEQLCSAELPVEFSNQVKRSFELLLEICSISSQKQVYFALNSGWKLVLKFIKDCSTSLPLSNIMQQLNKQSLEHLISVFDTTNFIHIAKFYLTQMPQLFKVLKFNRETLQSAAQFIITFQMVAESSKNADLSKKISTLPSFILNSTSNSDDSKLELVKLLVESELNLNGYTTIEFNRAKLMILKGICKFSSIQSIESLVSYMVFDSWIHLFNEIDVETIKNEWNELVALIVAFIKIVPANLFQLVESRLFDTLLNEFVWNELCQDVMAVLCIDLNDQVVQNWLDLSMKIDSRRVNGFLSKLLLVKKLPIKYQQVQLLSFTSPMNDSTLNKLLANPPNCYLMAQQNQQSLKSHVIACCAVWEQIVAILQSSDFTDNPAQEFAMYSLQQLSCLGLISAIPGLQNCMELVPSLDECLTVAVFSICNTLSSIERIVSMDVSLLLNSGLQGDDGDPMDFMISTALILLELISLLKDYLSVEMKHELTNSIGQWSDSFIQDKSLLVKAQLLVLDFKINVI